MSGRGNGGGGDGGSGGERRGVSAQRLSRLPEHLRSRLGDGADPVVRGGGTRRGGSGRQRSGREASSGSSSGSSGSSRRHRGDSLLGGERDEDDDPTAELLASAERQRQRRRGDARTGSSKRGVGRSTSSASKRHGRDRGDDRRGDRGEPRRGKRDAGPIGKASGSSRAPEGAAGGSGDGGKKDDAAARLVAMLVQRSSASAASQASAAAKAGSKSAPLSARQSAKQSAQHSAKQSGPSSPSSDVGGHQATARSGEAGAAAEDTGHSSDRRPQGQGQQAAAREQAQEPRAEQQRKGASAHDATPPAPTDAEAAGTRATQGTPPGTAEAATGASDTPPGTPPGRGSEEGGTPEQKRPKLTAGRGKLREEDKRGDAGNGDEVPAVKARSTDESARRAHGEQGPEKEAAAEEEEEEEEQEEEHRQHRKSSAVLARKDDEHAVETQDPLDAFDHDMHEEEPEVYFPAEEGCRSIDVYERLNMIDEGTYGVVFRVKDTASGEVLAVKRLKMEAEREGFPITSLREINTLLKAKHENVVDVREIVIGRTMNDIFIVMEFVEHDLKSLLETMKQPLLQAEVKMLMQQLLRGVHHLHDNWIIHRDLKTSNLLLSHRGVLKIADFGLAREFGSPLKIMTQMVVTLWYRAPELLLGEKKYTAAIDVWSVGCIFAELITSKPLFPGKGEIDTIKRIFTLLGTPSEEIWDGYNQLPAVQKVHFAKKYGTGLINEFGNILNRSGLDLLSKLLTYDPTRRITSADSLDHAWFQDFPPPTEPELFPHFPARAEGHRRRHDSPSAPMGGQMNEEERELYMLMKESKPSGFSLKFG